MKKAYTKPNLSVYGTVEEITACKCPGNGDRYGDPAEWEKKDGKWTPVCPSDHS